VSSHRSNYVGTGSGSAATYDVRMGTDLMTPGYERAIGLTGRVKVGAYYTDGKCLGEIYKVARLGHIMVRECETGEIFGYGIDAFRAHWWLVAERQEAA
jgi:hypothetical protein